MWRGPGVEKGKHNAHRMITNDDVAARLAEIQERADALTEITVASLTADLLRVAQKSEALGDASGLSVARGTYMDIGKLNGLVIERQERGKPGEFDAMSQDELRSYIEGQAAELGIRRVN